MEPNAKPSKLTAVDLLLQETLTSKEVAAVLNVSPRAVEDLRRAGKLKFVLVSGQKRIYRIQDVREFINGNVRQGVSED